MQEGAQSFSNPVAVGPAHRRPFVHLHDWPSDRLKGLRCADTIDDVGARLSELERPGSGVVACELDVRIIDWSSRVGALARSVRVLA